MSAALSCWRHRCVIFASVLFGCLAYCEGFVASGSRLMPLNRVRVQKHNAIQMSTPNKKKAKPHQLVSKWLKSEIVPTLVQPVVDIHADQKEGTNYAECNLYKMEQILRVAQAEICDMVEELDGRARFCEDDYTRPNTANSHLAVVDGTLQQLENPRPDGGGGRTMVLSDGAVFEKAGIAMSVIYGQMPSEALALTPDRRKFASNNRREGYKKGETVPFACVGLSAVFHPRNPFCPTLHFNYRYFETDKGNWWFGGGTDITPSYLDEEDMRAFHGVYKRECDKVDPEYYSRFKAWADDYFTIQHRGETRGLGGIFFDDLNDRPATELLQFVESCLKAVPEAYAPIIRKHRDTPFTQEQKEWQQVRRGRYVEFNLVYDRGVVFGLQSGLGRVESILMSLPEGARWEYDHSPQPGTPEAEIAEAFKNPRDWL